MTFFTDAEKVYSVEASYNGTDWWRVTFTIWPSNGWVVVNRGELGTDQALLVRVMGKSSYVEPTEFDEVGTWDESLGNSRAVVRVSGSDSSTRAVWARVPWRRLDAPSTKDVWVYDGKTGNRISNVLRGGTFGDYGDVIFEPLSGDGVYMVYYMPYTTTGEWYAPIPVYDTPSNTASSSWTTSSYLSAQTVSLRGGTPNLPMAEMVRIQARHELYSFEPMEIPPTREELAVFNQKYEGNPMLLFVEPRERSIRMMDHLLGEWTVNGPTTEFEASVLRGEFFTFQIGVFANGADVTGLELSFPNLVAEKGVSTISAENFRCFTFGGVGELGVPFTRSVGVYANQVQPLWIGVEIPADARGGLYEGIVTLKGTASKQVVSREVVLRIYIDAQADPATGDETMSHLRWLDSKLGLDYNTCDPFPPIEQVGNILKILGRDITIGENGLPQSIRSYFSPSVTRIEPTYHEVFAAPVEFRVTTGGVVCEWETVSKVEFEELGTGRIDWSSEMVSGPLTLNCTAHLESDGCIDVLMNLSSIQSVNLNNVQLYLTFPEEIAQYFMGMGQKGGKRPDQLNWYWNRGIANNFFWTGDVNAGLYCRLKDTDDRWDFLYQYGSYKDWKNNNLGGAKWSRDTSGNFVFEAYSGAMQVSPTTPRVFHFCLLATPFKFLESERWNINYLHVDPHSTPIPAVPWAKERDVDIYNIHQGPGNFNPHINYPFRTADNLKNLVNAIHEGGMRANLYYTVRELSVFADEFWMLRSLWGEVFSIPTTTPSYLGGSWLQEHARYNYSAAWHSPMLDGSFEDAAVPTRTNSRWNNYYCEGLNWLLSNVGIDGLYIDGTGYSREITKRIRKIIRMNNPDGTMDFHSGDNYGTGTLCNSACVYMEHFPYFDSLWLGEFYKYDEISAAEWLVEISGIPFGLRCDMLQDGGNPWRGMIFGSTARLGWHGDQNIICGIWKVWKDFGIAESEMLGYWDPNCPIRTTLPDDVLVTVYRKEHSALVAIASWAETEQTISLKIDTDKLGFTPSVMWCPEITNLQSEQNVPLESTLTISPKKGVILLIRE